MPTSISVSEIRQGLLRGEIRPYFQPQILLESGSVYGAEVLARWEHPVFGRLSPAMFIPQIEKTGLMDELFEIFLLEGCRLQKQLSEKQYNLNLSYNLSPSQLCSSKFIRSLKKMLKWQELPPANITFEIVESSEFTDLVIALENLREIRQLGFNLSLDDLGIGYSSLSRLRDIPFTEIKIDKTFLEKMSHERKSKPLISLIIEIGKALDLQVIAEGVESAEQCRELWKAGCRIAQGNWFKEAVPAEIFKHWLLLE
ncbi:EAL domain-containing protein [Pseudomonas aeruginosa]|uniref:EAL domain-containing protein n=1 Tax=Pseudomonas aeruginosa TaxID=287 RepID=UPI002254D1DE|nr:EAL domain-containing protein [Pseudomonas aeruginosa]MCX4212099.1 EAL domain-containing protein [Pseudomonas aeruginosa]MCX4230978.1 EAL domain-containing protein [Pseudomonas aeruginosa]